MTDVFATGINTDNSLSWGVGMLPFFTMLQAAVALHSAWVGKPGDPPPPPEYNAAIGDLIDDTAPAEVWQCTMQPTSKMDQFKLVIDNKRVRRYYGSSRIRDDFVVLSNSTLGSVAARPVNDVEDGRPGIGAFTIALNKETGGLIFSAEFVADENLPIEGVCKREPS